MKPLNYKCSVYAWNIMYLSFTKAMKVFFKQQILFLISFGICCFDYLFETFTSCSQNVLKQHWHKPAQISSLAARAFRHLIHSARVIFSMFLCSWTLAPKTPKPHKSFKTKVPKDGWYSTR